MVLDLALRTTEHQDIEELLLPDVHADPEEIEAFAHVLSTYAQSTRDGLAQVAGQLRQMGESTWQDQQYASFEQSFQELENSIRMATGEIETVHVPHLHRLVADLREFLSR